MKSPASASDSEAAEETAEDKHESGWCSICMKFVSNSEVAAAEAEEEVEEEEGL